MKIRSLLIVSFILAFSSIAFTQSVVITPKKVAYKRPKPFTDYKKSFTITYPKVKGLSSALSKKIENTVSYEKAFNLNIKQEMNEIQWLEEASYEVNYNKNGVLGITLTLMGSGAYPSEYSKPVIVNLKTGERVKPQDIFVRLSELVARCKNAQQTEVKKAIVEIKKENPEEENPASLFQNANFTLKDLNEFSISDRGITFWYDYGFPHVIKAFQPEGRYFFSFAELKPFIKRDGLLAWFIR